MTRWENIAQSLRLHLTVAERAAKIAHDEAQRDPSYLEGVRWTDGDYSSSAAAFDLRGLLRDVQAARIQLDRLEHHEAQAPTE